MSMKEGGETDGVHAVVEDHHHHHHAFNGGSSSNLPPRNMMTPLDDFGRSFTSNWSSSDNSRQEHQQQRHMMGGDSTIGQDEASSSTITTSMMHDQQHQRNISFSTTLTDPSSHASTMPSTTNTLSDDVSSYPSITSPTAAAAAAAASQPPPAQPAVVTPQQERAGGVAYLGKEQRLSHASPQEPPGFGKETGRRTAPLTTPPPVLVDENLLQQQQQQQQQHQQQWQQEQLHAVAEPVSFPFNHIPDETASYMPEFAHCVVVVDAIQEPREPCLASEAASSGRTTISTTEASTVSTLSKPRSKGNRVSLEELRVRGAATVASNASSTSYLDMDWSFLKQGILYERETEIQLLQNAFEQRLLPSARPELIVLTGGPGAGKSTLVKKVFCQPSSSPTSNSRSPHLIMGKFDPLQRPEPYAAFVEAMTDYIDSLSRSSKNSNDNGLRVLSDLKRAIVGSGTHAMDDLSTLSRMVPALKNLLQKHHINQDNVSVHTVSTIDSVSLQEASQDYLKVLIRRFFRGISSVERPIVLLLDDLHWADPSSLELLELLVSDANNAGFVIVATCRPDIQTTNPTLSAMMDRLEQEKDTLVNMISVRNLSGEATNHLLSDVLQQPTHVCKALAEMIYEPTNGNPFHIIRLLRELRKNKVLVPGQESNSWLWDADSYEEFRSTAIDTVGLIQRAIRALPDKCQLLLQTCACMGTEIDAVLLAQVLTDTFVPDTSFPILRAGLLYQDPHRRPGKYLFPHTLVHQAAYSLIPETQKSLFHLRIGKQLALNMSPDGSDDHIFLVVNQMNRGMAHLRTKKERDDLADLCLKAGNKASSFSDHNKASTLFILGTTLLHQSSCWKTNYELSLRLYTSLANAAFLVRDFEMADFAIQEVLKHALSMDDKAQVYATQVNALGSQLKLKEAMDLAMQVLKVKDAKMVHNLSSTSLANALTKTKKLLKVKSDSDILGLQEMDDVAHHGTMGMLYMLAKYSLAGHPDMYPSLAYRMIKISLEHGLCPASAQGFVLYGLCLCNVGEVEAGLRYGKLALAILTRFGGRVSGEFQPRVFATFFGWIAHWQEPLRATMLPTLKAHRDCLESGDLEGTMVGAHVHCMNAFFAGVPLPQVEVKIQTTLKLTKGTQVSSWVHALAMQLQLVRNLMGKSKNPCSLKLDADLECYAVHSGHRVFPDTALQEKLWTLVLAYHMSDFELAMRMAKECHEAQNLVKSSYLTSVLHFYDAMTALVLAQRNKNRNLHLTTARKSLKILKALGEKFPINLNHKICFLDAEFSAINGSIDRALKSYTMAIVLADEGGFLQDQALACERAAELCLGGKEPAKARPFHENAKKLYENWGALAKVAQMPD